MMNLFRHELRVSRNATIIWTLSLSGLILFFMSMYPAISSDAKAFQNLLESYPQEVLVSLGISLETITSLLGFYSYVFTYIVLCTSIQAVQLGLQIISKESRDKTADFLLTKPVTRTSIITAKLMAALVLILITNGIFMVVARFTLPLFSDQSFDTSTFLLITSSSLWIAFFFLFIGMMASALLSPIKSVIALSLSMVFGFFVFSMLGAVVGEETIRYFTPFHYYDTAYILAHGTYEWDFVWIEVGLILVMGVLSYFLYRKKDIY
ncbi:ABC transporter permease subunit [Hazenella sp. IB182357]|uniref:ABC transporter permease subunit n=1 Tax=Polycladospora coralii TaxID=2771432 RepID=A0A926RUU0_9BACL|nr:ABC transporter permease subunit [Polycladospora coralii]MBD1373007.1 ABC transporter permease subunit [Polycladospora coralii]MBS7530934.1 ABC transporter permease subunit [Polycladospora coralii]